VEVHYCLSDVFVFPSMRDSGGLAVLEAMAHSLPVVCTDLGGPGVIVNNRCGRVVLTLGRSREDLVASCADALREIITAPELRDGLARGARTRAREFNFQNLVRSIHPLHPGRTPVDKNEYTLQPGALVSRDAAS
jgi:glycosyltransferase involved in cell wall biosynthesis